MRILFVFPEGNLANSPHLSAITQLLAERGHHVVVRAPRGPFFHSEDPRVQRIEIARAHQWALYQLSRTPAAWTVGRLLTRLNRAAATRPDIVVGVDRQGLLEAALVSKRLRVPLVYFSNEIFFDAECSRGFKVLERQAAGRAVLAISSDRHRARLLAEESGVDEAGIMCLPVAGTGARPPVRTHALHDALGIARTRRIAILAGSLTAWTAAARIVATVPEWPGEWVLVLHDRYGKVPGWVHSATAAHPGRVYASRGGVPTLGELGMLLHDADLGLALYEPTFDSIWTGRNLQHIGMSSGKIATCLQHGLPVLTNEIGEMAGHVRRERLGLVVTDPPGIPASLRGFDPDLLRESCLEFFRRHLDLSLHIDALERALVAACARTGSPA